MVACRINGVKKSKWDICRYITEGEALLVSPIEIEPNSIAAARQVVLKAVCDTKLLVSTQTAGLIGVGLLKNIAKNHAYRTDIGIKNLYAGLLFCMNVSRLGRVDITLP